MTKTRIKKRYLVGLGAGIIAGASILFGAQALAIFLILKFLVNIQVTYLECLGILLVWRVLTAGMGSSNIVAPPSKPESKL